MTEHVRRRSSPSLTTAAQWVGTAIAAVLLVFASAKLTAAEMQVAAFQSWGYPLWVMYAVGAAEVLAAGLLLFPRTSSWGGLIVLALVAGAIGTHVLAGEWMQLPLPAMTAGAAAMVTLARRADAIGLPEPRADPESGPA